MFWCWLTGKIRCKIFRYLMIGYIYYKATIKSVLICYKTPWWLFAAHIFKPIPNANHGSWCCLFVSFPWNRHGYSRIWWWHGSDKSLQKLNHWLNIWYCVTVSTFYLFVFCIRVVLFCNKETVFNVKGQMEPFKALPFVIRQYVNMFIQKVMHVLICTSVWFGYDKYIEPRLSGAPFTNMV